MGLSSKRSFPRLLSQSEVHMKVFSQFLLIVFLGAASMVASAEDGSERSLNAVKQFRENQQRIHGDKAVEQQKSSPSAQGEQDD
ncbi:hypothetical protein [Ectopseudomonas oleovorans]|nr:hypothetical protein [Pseudomonas oleovorans]